ncbi:hypothetical protein AMAG_13610 [Allomyces macrogynus ATCC 38327]|uniref:Ribosomal protein L22 n=1 Tax=Allomyces macrogynus (strain ATCC 38327) TaxID=578462 RepID=A0A0L0T3F9_ALLM3|nr:hypothetical protein AMAG_13610 [Allomyces macrogynus ATCC 38327]|eukprot:KNE69220.1 hypothetical protein AMAG_13610 [Allomyces macrogynus ATCC 38327]
MLALRQFSRSLAAVPRMPSPLAVAAMQARHASGKAKADADGEANLSVTASSVFDQVAQEAKKKQRDEERATERAAAGSGPYISKKSIVQTTGSIDYSPRKLNMLARQIKGLPITDALAQMQFAVKKPAPRLVGALKQALNAAKQAEFGDESKKGRGLVIAQAWVGKGIYKHGIRIHGRGRFGRLTSPSSHMKIELKESDVPLAPNRGNRFQGKGGFLPPKKERKHVKPILEEKPIYNKWKRLFYDA